MSGFRTYSYRTRTGAGDSFLTGFAIGILQELSLKKAISLGCCCGRIAVQSIGAPKVETFDNNTYLCEKPCHQCMLVDLLHYNHAKTIRISDHTKSISNRQSETI